eukprot:499094_1
MTHLITFDDCLCIGQLIININTVGTIEKDLVTRLHQFLTDKQHLNAEKHLLTLLNINNNNAQYNFLCADCYLSIYFDNKTASLRNKIEYYYTKALQIEPNNVMYLHCYTIFLSHYDDPNINNNQKLIAYYSHLLSIFQTKSYQYDAKSTDIDYQELLFQRECLSQLVISHRMYNTYDTIFETLTKLEYQFKRLLSLRKLINSNQLYGLTQLYVNGYSRIGHYKKACQLLDEYNKKYNHFSTVIMNVCEYFGMYLEMAMYDKLKISLQIVSNFRYRHWEWPEQKDDEYHINPAVCHYFWFSNKIVGHAYLCLLHAYKKTRFSDRLINKISLRRQKLIKQYRGYLCNKKQHHPLFVMQDFDVVNIPMSIQFMNVCYVYLCMVKNVATNQRKKYEEIIQILRTIKINEDELSKNCQGQMGHIPLFINLMYVLGLIINYVKRDHMWIEHSKNLDKDENFYFLKCLSYAQQCIDSDRNWNNKVSLVSECIWIHPNIPLSYYHIGANALKMRKYQIAFKFLKKSRNMTQDLEIINTNCKRLLQKCRKYWIQQICGYCGKKCEEISRRNRSCKGCGVVFYCSKRCSKLNWKAKHKYECDRTWLQPLNYLKIVW